MNGFWVGGPTSQERRNHKEKKPRDLSRGVFTLKENYRTMKIYLSLTKKPRLRKPIMICVWPGMGEVAFKLGVYLRDKLKMVKFASLEAPELFPPTGIWIQNTIIQLPKSGAGKFYFFKNKNATNDIILFISDAQPLLEHAYDYCKRILSLGKELGVKRILTFAAMPQAIDDATTPEVWFSVTHKKIIEELEALKIGLKLLAAGQVSGLNGLLLGMAKESGFEGICLLGEIPLFTIQIENPKTQHGAPGPIGEEEIEKIKKSLSLQTKLPKSAMEKIEKLFQEVKQNIAKASELKKELDQWNVYKEYEDMFLDLFKKPKDKEERTHN